MKNSPVPNAQLRYLTAGYVLGGIVASIILSTLLVRWNSAGTPVPPTLSTARFSVAMLAGPKQSAQTAPENVDQVVEAVAPSPEPLNAPVVAALRETSLPDAVKAAQQTTPKKVESKKPPKPAPPAKVAMPGGELAAVDSGIGDASPNPFDIKARQVYIRLMVDSTGRVVRYVVVRSGGDSLRDNLILRAMKSRTYDTKRLIRLPGNEPLWQLDMVLDYGTNDFLP